MVAPRRTITSDTLQGSLSLHCSSPKCNSLNFKQEKNTQNHHSEQQLQQTGERSGNEGGRGSQSTRESSPH